MPDTTTVQVRKETWSALNKQRTPGETFDDVIQELLKESNNA
jgi:predicted CopG family antitoxin